MLVRVSSFCLLLTPLRSELLDNVFAPLKTVSRDSGSPEDALLLRFLDSVSGFDIVDDEKDVEVDPGWETVPPDGLCPSPSLVSVRACLYTFPLFACCFVHVSLWQPDCVSSIRTRTLQQNGSPRNPLRTSTGCITSPLGSQK